MNNFFVDCVDEVRKDIARRKLKQDMSGDKKRLMNAASTLLDQNQASIEEIQSMANVDSGQSLEETLIKLAKIYKSKIKLQDFT